MNRKTYKTAAKWGVLAVIALAIMLAWGHASSPTAEVGPPPPPPAPNDMFDDATIIDLRPFFDIIDTTGTTGGGNDPTFNVVGCPAFPQLDKTVWYEYTPKLNQQIRLETSGSSYDTVVAVHTGDKGSLVGIACNDDKQVAPFGLHSISKLEVTKGETYYIVVAELAVPGDGVGGTLSFSLQATTPEFNLLLDGVGTEDCNTHANDKKCRVAPGDKFTVTVALESLGNLLDTNTNGVNGYTQALFTVDYSWNLTHQATVDAAPACLEKSSSVFNFRIQWSCNATGVDDESDLAGIPLADLTFRCPPFKSKETITLVQGTFNNPGGTLTTQLLGDDSTYVYASGPSETIVINCDNYYPWDVHGPGGSAELDGIVDLPNDILGVILHFCPLIQDPCSKPNLP